jgi:hypothetical protein
MKTKTVAEVLELSGVDTLGLTFKEIEKLNVNNSSYNKGANYILNQHLEANKICVVDRQKASKIISDSLLELVFNDISDYDLSIVTDKISDRIENCVKFREGGV